MVMSASVKGLILALRVMSDWNGAQSLLLAQDIVVRHSHKSSPKSLLSAHHFLEAALLRSEAVLLQGSVLRGVFVD